MRYRITLTLTHAAIASIASGLANAALAEWIRRSGGFVLRLWVGPDGHQTYIGDFARIFVFLVGIVAVALAFFALGRRLTRFRPWLGRTLSEDAGDWFWPVQACLISVLSLIWVFQVLSPVAD